MVNPLAQPFNLGEDLFGSGRDPMRAGMRAQFLRSFEADVVEAEAFEEKAAE